MDEQKNPNIMLESDLPADLKTVAASPIIPSQQQTPPAAGDTLPPYFRGSIAPTLQHDVSLVKSGINPRQANIPLMPPAPSGNPQNNAAIKSIIQATATTTTDVDPFMHYRGVWSSSISYLINDVVTFNGSLYMAIQSSLNLQPDNNHDSNSAEGSAIGSPAWTLLSENFVFSPTPPHQISTGGFSVYDTGTMTVGSGTSFSVSGTPSGANEIALLTVALSNGGNSVNSGLTGWTFITNRGSSWSYYYKILTGSGPVTASGGLSISDNWNIALDFFQFGGFASVNASQVTVNAANQITILVGNSSGLLVAGQIVQFNNFVGASFLNGGTMTISTANATQITGTIGAGHANYGPTADSGTVTVILQQVGGETSGAEFPPIVFNPLTAKASDVFIVTSIAGGIFSGGGSLGPYTDTNGNSYTSSFGLNTNGGAHFTLNNGYSSPNKQTGSITITISGGSNLTSAGYGIIELAGSASVPLYQPYDVVQFRGSMFICLTETTNDAFQQPSAWGLIGPGTGFVNSQAGNYNIVALDSGHLVQYTGSGAGTFTLPNPVPSPAAGVSETGWYVLIQNIGTGTLTIARNGLTIDGVAGNLTLGQNQGVVIFADTTGNYETWHGVNSVTMPNIFVVSGPNGSGLVSITLATQNANLVFAGPASGGAATPTFRALVNADLPATVPTVPTEFTLTGNVASPAGVLTIGKATQGPHLFWKTGAVAAQPTFGPIVQGDIPNSAIPPLALTAVILTQETTSLSGVFLVNGARPVAGIYRVSANFFLQANPSAGTLAFSIGYNDGTASRTVSPGPIDTSALNVGETDITIVSDGLHDITWSMTLV